MADLLGKEEVEVPVITNAGEGRLVMHERGLVLELPGINGQVKAYYASVRELELGRKLPLGKREARMVVFDMMGQRFDVRFGCSEQRLHELRERCRR